MKEIKKFMKDYGIEYKLDSDKDIEIDLSGRTRRDERGNIRNPDVYLPHDHLKGLILLALAHDLKFFIRNKKLVIHL